MLFRCEFRRVSTVKAQEVRNQPILVKYPQERLLKALKVVVDEQAFSPLRKRIMTKKLEKLAKHGNLGFDSLDAEWLYRICAASLMQHDYHWFCWEWRSAWANELATKRWVYPPWFGIDQDCKAERPPQKRVLVVAEQGVGDEIVFASCYNDLAADVEEAWIECDPRLIPIFERSFPENLHFVDRFVDAKRRIVPRASDYPEFHKGLPIEAFIMAGNVPKLYRHSPADFPDRLRFLRPNPELYGKWNAWLWEQGQGSVGCSWKGRQGEIEPIKTGISLQYGETDHRGLVVPPIDLKWDFEEIFGLISALGRVVTTTNAVAHMAGALGVGTDCIKPPPIYATKDDGFNNRVTPWWPVDYTDWYPSITMYRSQQEWRVKQ